MTSFILFPKSGLIPFFLLIYLISLKELCVRVNPLPSHKLSQYIPHSYEEMSYFKAGFFQLQLPGARFYQAFVNILEAEDGKQIFLFPFPYCIVSMFK